MADSLLQFFGNPALHINSRSNHHRRPTAMIMSQSQSYWASINADIEDHLRRAIPLRRPLSVFEPMHHLVFAAPRNTAPALCIAACEVVGGHRDQAMAAASALHLMYAAAFTRQHLRPENNSRPSVHHVYGPNIELLTGDGMVPFGYELLARADDPTQENSERILRVMIEIARAMGSQGWVEGQFAGLEMDGSSGDLSLVERVSQRTEGGLHGCGAACGAILGGGSKEDIEKLRRFGLLVGIRKGLSEIMFGGKEKKMEELKNLALKEVECFHGGKVHQISGFLDIHGF